MSTPVNIIGPCTISNKKNAVAITSRGAMVVAPYAYSEVKADTLDTANVAVNFFLPKIGKSFVVTDMLLTANKNVTTDCTVEMYEATAVDSLVVDKSILNIEMLKNSDRDLIGLNLRLSEGVFLNGKTDDDDVFVTIMGYYVPA